MPAARRPAEEFLWLGDEAAAASSFRRGPRFFAIVLIPRMFKSDGRWRKSFPLADRTKSKLSESASSVKLPPPCRSIRFATVLNQTPVFF